MRKARIKKSGLSSILSVMLVGTAGYAWAFAPVGVDKSAPTYLVADEVHYDKEKEMVTASGHVEAVQGQRILLADRIVYDQKLSKMYAKGNISLLEPTGDVYFADQLELGDNFKEGIIHEFSERLADNSLLAARTAVRQNGNKIILHKAVYSPCPVCNDKPDAQPQWQIKANKVEVDEEKEKVKYRNARLEAYGIPFFYTPYFSHALPNAKSQSGFLEPSFHTSSILGTYVETPYFINLKPNMDATIAPITTSKVGIVMTGEFRHLVENGYYEMQGSITRPEKIGLAGEPAFGREMRGHIEGKGKFKLEDDWRWGFDFKRASDDTYLRRYHFGNEDDLKSELYWDQLKHKDYTSVQFLSFQGLNQIDNSDTAPNALPLINMHKETIPVAGGGHWFMDANGMSLLRLKGIRSNRLSLRGGYALPYITGNGQKIELSSSLRGDAYHEDDGSSPASARNPNLNGAVARLIPEAQLTWSYPLVRHNATNRIYVEPTAQFIVSPYGGNSSHISNEDSMDYELSDINLFSSHHYTGLDRLETGPRANIGIKGAIHSYAGSELGMMFGENFRLREDRYFDPAGGLGDNRSDYVGNVTFRNKDLFDLSYRFRLNKNDFSAERTDIVADVLVAPFTITAAYLSMDRDFVTGTNKEEIASSIKYDFAKHWDIQLAARQDLTGDTGLVTAASMLEYKGDCTTATLDFGRDLTSDRDVRPSTSINLRIKLKNLE